jgi:hypothetical protein
MVQYLGSNTGGGGQGNVNGPASSIDETVARFNGVDGKIVQGSGVIIDNDNNMTGIDGITVNQLNYTTLSPAIAANTVSSLTSADRSVAIYDGNNKEAIKSSGIIVDVDNNITVPGRLNVSSAFTNDVMIGDTVPPSYAGNSNVVVGKKTGGALTGGHSNVLVGFTTSNTLTAGVYTTSIGSHAGATHNSGVGNTFLGSYADSNQSSCANRTSIGSGCRSSLDNSCTIGNEDVTNILGMKNNQTDLGTTGTRFKNLWLAGDIRIAGSMISQGVSSTITTPIPISTPVLSANGSDGDAYWTQASSEYNSIYQAFKAVDTSANTWWASGNNFYSGGFPNSDTFNTGSATIAGSWLKIGTDTLYSLVNYRFIPSRTSTEMPVSWHIYGSTDNANYKLIDQRDNYASVYLTTTNVFTLVVPATIKQFVIVVTKIAGGGSGATGLTNLVFNV